MPIVFCNIKLYIQPRRRGERDLTSVDPNIHITMAAATCVVSSPMNMCSRVHLTKYGGTGKGTRTVALPRPAVGTIIEVVAPSACIV